MEYTYYDDGMRKTMTTPEGQSYKYLYDANGRLRRLQREAGGDYYDLGWYSYDALGRRTQLDRRAANAMHSVLLASSVYSYDEDYGWVTSVRNIVDAQTIYARDISRFEYSNHNKLGMPRTVEVCYNAFDSGNAPDLKFRLTYT